MTGGDALGESSGEVEMATYLMVEVSEIGL